MPVFVHDMNGAAGKQQEPSFQSRQPK